VAPALRPFRFAANPHGAPTAAAWRDLARRVEDLGYSALYLPDHVNPQLAPTAGLVAAAAATTTVRLGVQVLNNDLRHPVVAAKEVASLDVLSDGRAEWGMGAGWHPTDYDARGETMDPGSVRVERLAEAIGLMRGLFAGGEVDHAGAHYRVRLAAGTPAPVQRPHPPLLVGAAHERMLRLAGREADVVSISPAWDSRTFGGRPPSIDVEASLARQVGWVREAAGDRADAIELSVTAFPVRITDRPEDVAAEVGPHVGLDGDQALASPHVLLGTVDGLCEELLARRERLGITHVVVPPGAIDAFAPVVARLAGT
jgi:probable F420-dependent oxidoreductase